MKTLIFSLIAALAVFSLSAAVLTVDNNIPSSGMYTTFNAAYNAAANGDIIMIYPSTMSYGGYSIAKQLTIVGAGTDPANPDMVTTKFAPSVNNVEGSGTVFIGLDVYISTSSSYPATWRNCVFSSSLSILRDGTALEECLFKSSVTIGNGTIETHDTTIKGCTFDNDSTKLNLNNLASCVLYNCLFYGNSYAVNCAQSNTTAAFNHCLFVNRDTGSLRLATGQTSTGNLIFINNIFETITYIPANFTYLYNIWEGSPTEVTDPSNYLGVNLANVMIDVNGGDYHYTASSLAYGNGQYGADIGLYGGDTPYDDLWYLTYLPSIVDFDCPAIINQAGQLDVHIEAKVGN
ncbi:MAG: hypothetical protein K0B87_00575 [Candidatus Syntrophosphaera sp.]|nr:hypothetical protein [Candidatus Syntrophosphaera sp.]